MAASPGTKELAESLYVPLGRAERLIATGRVILAAFSLLAISLDPSEPAKYARLTYTLLAGYVLYALALAILAWRREALLPALRMPTHVFDLCAFSVFMYLTEGPTSPFFVYFVFSLVAATVRWQWRGTLWTALAALGIFLALGWYAAEVLRDPEFELNRFIIRSVYLAVVAALLGYLGGYEQGLRSELARLVAWPSPAPEDAQALVRGLLERAAGILDAPGTVMVWEEPEEPWVHVASWSSGEFRWVREPPGTLEPLVTGRLAGADFFCQDAGAADPLVVYGSAGSVGRWRGAPLHRDFRARFTVGPVLSVALSGESLVGRLFWLDKRGMTSDDLLLARVVAGQVAAGMDRLHMLERLRLAAAAEERVRLARDLHDGLLQSLTAGALQLETARGLLLAGRAEAARERLAETQLLIASEQRDLRAFVQDLRPVPLAPGTPLAAHLEHLASLIEGQWGLPVKLRVEPSALQIGNALADQVFLLVREALVNAARHSSATAAGVELASGDGQVTISVTDDGRGFPFRGRYDHAALTELGLGPVSLRERVATLGGSLTVESTEAGARLEITLPLPPPGAPGAH